MQQFSEKTFPIGVDRLLPVTSVQLVVASAAIVLAFVPLVPPVEALEGGMTTRGIIEFGLILAGLALLAIYLKLQGAFSFEVQRPGFLLISLFVFWSVLSSLWSPNPLLTIAKAAELWALALAAMMIVTLAARSHFSEGKLETILALSMIAVVGGLIVANIFYWGKPFPTTGDSSLALDVFGDELSEERPRLILAYQHALLSADLLAITIICLFVSRLKQVLKGALMAGLLALFWLTNARGPAIALTVALVSLAILKVRRNNVRAIAVMLAISLALAGVLVFQDQLPAVLRSAMTDDVYTLNSRTELWAGTLKSVLAQPILGTGYYASRYVLIKDFSWAGHAHNSFLEVLLTTGLIGLLILFAFVGYVFKEISRTRSALLLGITLYCLIQGMLNPLFFYPGLAMFVLTIALLAPGPRQTTAGT
jgi:O-antigen ligase